MSSDEKKNKDNWIKLGNRFDRTRGSIIPPNENEIALVNSKGSNMEHHPGIRIYNIANNTWRLFKRRSAEQTLWSVSTYN